MTTAAFIFPCPDQSELFAPWPGWAGVNNCGNCGNVFANGSVTYVCSMRQGHSCDHWYDAGLGWSRGFTWPNKGVVAVNHGPTVLKGGKFQRDHQTAVFIEIASPVEQPFYSRVRRQVESYNNSMNGTDTIKTDVYMVTDGKISKYDEGKINSGTLGTVPGGATDEMINEFCLKLGYTMMEFIRQPKFDVSVLKAKADKVRARLDKVL